MHITNQIRILTSNTPIEQRRKIYFAARPQVESYLAVMWRSEQDIRREKKFLQDFREEMLSLTSLMDSVTTAGGEA